MKKYIKRFWGSGLLIALFIIIIIFSVFNHFDTYLDEEIGRNLKLQNNYITVKIENELQMKAQIVENVSNYIKFNSRQENQYLLDYLESILIETESLESIYFGSPDNYMINGSGWKPPDDFQLQTRPWYTEAINHKSLVFTDVFLNASNDKHIITISKPIYDENQKILGVVGADLSVMKIIELIENQNMDSGYSFLLDGQEKVVASSDGFEKVLQDLIQAELGELGKLKNQSIEISSIEIEGELGYIIISEIENTDLILGNVIFKESYSTYQNQLKNSLLITLLAVIIIFIFMLTLQRLILLQPLFRLDQDIKKIPISKNIFYRLPVENKDPFQIIRQSVNQALNEIEILFNELKYKQEELEDSNKELIAILTKVKACEEELNQQHNMLLENKLLLETSEIRNRAIISVLPDIIFVYDSEGTFIDCQTKDKNNLLISKENFIGKNLSDVIPREIASKAIESIKKTLDSEDINKFEYPLTINNQMKYFETRMVKISSNQVLAIVRDITFEKREQDFILELSLKDHLTGLYNRRYFEEKLEKMDETNCLPFSIMMIDVNGLKLTNDAYGHFAGDKLLKKVAEILNSNCIEEGFVSRVGGDEFVMVCPNTDKEKTENIVDKLYDDIEYEELNNIVISISVGWAIRESMDQSMRDTFIKAENHMFRKKIVESQSMRNKTIQVIMETLNEKSEREKKHSVEVSKWSKKIGQAMLFNSQLLKELETAGLVHDIGKIAVREEVLNKSGKLTEEEYDEIKKHSESGYQILKSVDAYSSLAEDVLAHHERYDGKGYPRGLKGEQIPLVARIICIADAYEAMVSDRSYRKGIPHQNALDEIKRCSGTQFDPVITKIFISLFE